MSQFKITCFSDEISPVLEEQLDLLEGVGISHLEIRNVWGKNVLDLSTDELHKLSGILKSRKFTVSSIASPIGKYAVKDPFGPQLEAMNRAIQAATILKTPYIRVFSYFLPEDEPRETYRDEVLNRMSQLAHAAQLNQIMLLLENDSSMYGSTFEGGLDIARHCQSPSLKFAFDPGNYVIEGIDPMLEAFPKVADLIAYIHIKDATRSPRLFVPAGEGEGSLEPLLIALNERNYSGFLSVEPHLHHYLPEASNPERVLTAIQALIGLLEKNELKWQ